MKGGRGSQSLSSVSSRSLSSDRKRHGHRSSRHSMDSDGVPPRKYHRKMKFIIAVGVALPIIAAIIGVVAWAVSADSAFKSPAVKSLRRSDLSIGNTHEEDIFQILEDRHDPSYSHHSFVRPPSSNDLSRVDGDQDTPFDDTTEKDPLYIVHFVPSPKPKVEASTSVPSYASTVSSDVLKKILSASKGTKPGTPQFVVFAPLPSAEDEKENSGDLSSMGSSGLNFLSKAPAPQNPAIDYDYEEELRKYQAILDGNDQKESETSDKSQTKVHKQSMQVVEQNFTSGSVYLQQQPAPLQNSRESNSVYQYNQQAQFPPAATEQNPQQVYNQPQQVNYDNQQQHAYNQPQQVNYDTQQQHVYNQQQVNYDNQPQQVYNQRVYPSQQSEQAAYQQGHQQPQAVDRSGHYEPLGIKLSLGNGGGHSPKGLLGGGGYSPLGIISSILSPVIRRPKVNLNGKLMFGVMLEKGVKFGDEKRHAFG